MNNNINSDINNRNNKKRSIFGSRAYYKPFDYEEFVDGWSKQQSMFWTQYEISMTSDKQQYYNQLTDDEKTIITLVLRFFTQSDVEVSKGYMALMQVFDLYEVKAMLISFANMETIHVSAYAYLVDELSLPSTIFSDFLKYEETKAKYDYLNNFDVSSKYEILKTIAIFSAFTEGVSLFSSFCMLINLSRFSLLKGLAQVATFSMRDETLHNRYMTFLFRRVFEEIKHEINVDQLQIDIQKICMDIVHLEDNFIDSVFLNRTMRGITPDEIKTYIRKLSIIRIKDLGLEAPKELVYDNSQYPNWIDKVTNLREQVDFFSSRPTEYSKRTDEWDIFGDSDKK